jgi:hypothetical protein
MVTHDATKRSLVFAVAAFGMPTGTTALARVGRIDKRYRYTAPLCLVTDKRPQLRKGPIAVSRSLPWPFNPRPRSDTLEVFKDNRPLRAFGFGKEPLADVVIRICLESTLAACNLAQAAFALSSVRFSVSACAGVGSSWIAADSLII